MNNILVTGGAGFIGSNFIRYLLRTEPEVTINNLDALTYAGRMENLDGILCDSRHNFIHGDICDRSLVIDILRKNRIDTIVHFAAESHVDRSILGPAAFIEANITGTFTLLEAARQYWIVDQSLPLQRVRFHHVSTDEVYGSLSPEDPPFAETTAYDPSSPYSASKAASDHLVRAYYRTYCMPVTISNCSNNYGSFQFPEKLIPLIILNAIRGLPLPIYGDGQQIRDWLYVEDHCEAIWQVIQKGHIGETYNIGGDNQPTNLEIVKSICTILDKRFPSSKNVPHELLIEYITDRPGHDRRYAMNINKIKTELGWQPTESLETGLRKTIDWYLDHPGWIKTVRQKQDYQGWLQQNYTKRGEEK
jgi:dTDP-glucose 4,6-dehydratase